MRQFPASFFAIALSAAFIGCRPSRTIIIDPAPPSTSTTNSPAGSDPGEPLPATAESALAGLAPVELAERLANQQDRDAATKLLVRLGAEAVPVLMPALKHEAWQVRAAAAFTLGQLHDQAQPAAAELKSLAENDPEPAVRDAASFALDAIQGN